MSEDEEDEKKQPGNTRPGKIAFAGFLLGLVVLLGIVAWASGWDSVFANWQNPETEDAYADGTTRPLSARVTGYVTRVLVDDNEAVQAGQVLLVIEDDNYRAAVDQLRAQLRGDDATIAALGAAVIAANDNVGRTLAVTESVRATAGFAGEEQARQGRILRSDLGLLRSFQLARSQAHADTAAVHANESEVEVARAARATANAAVATAIAIRNVVAAQLRVAELNLDYTRVRAPQDGVLTLRGLHVGDLATPGKEIVSMTPLDDVWVTAYFSERQMQHVRPGQPARVSFDMFPGVVLPAHVDTIGPLTANQFSGTPPDNVTGNYTKVVQRVPVKIVLDRATNTLFGRIRPGQSALARVETDGAALVRPAR